MASNSKERESVLYFRVKSPSPTSPTNFPCICENLSASANKKVNTRSDSSLSPHRSISSQIQGLEYISKNIEN